MQVITNNQPRELVSLYDLPAKVQQDFDYVLEQGDYSERFVRYMGAWYDVFDTGSIGKLGFDQFKGWDGIVFETFFSGVLFKIVDDGYAVVCGRYFS